MENVMVPKKITKKEWDRKTNEFIEAKGLSSMGMPEKIKALGLLHFAGDENMSPEFIDEVINSTIELRANTNVDEIAAQIKKNKEAHLSTKMSYFSIS